MTPPELMQLPHQPYVDAVVRAVGEAGYPTGPDSFTEYDRSDGELMWLEASVDLGSAGFDQDDDDDPEDLVRAGLAWKQTTGWLVGDYDGRGGYEHVQPVFAPGAVLPTPEAVAAAVRQLFTGGLRYRQTADDTPPTEKALPDAVAEALEVGDITADLAARLAAYWPAV
ncbi:hypothetical protein ACIGZJ_31875 [Kitasatospora sp. NPDC052868]|uniref:hypothetical protein n=1 Tax=Kitasatospora sp. NPDC052868 TaxID=3364060 RepID=UPI0037CC6F69